MTRQRGSGLRNYYTLYVEIGLVLSLFVLVTAARVDLTPDKQDLKVNLKTQEVVRMEEVMQTKQQNEPPPPPRAPVPVQVPDNTVIEQQDIDFDASLDLSASLDTTMGAPASSSPDPDPNDAPPEDEIFVAVEQQPELIGGMRALQQAIDYPPFAEKAGIQGRVFVQFVVDENGNVQNPQIQRGVHKLINEEALRVVKEMQFRPGKQRGTPVKVQMTLPVTFKLKQGEPSSGS
jgi:protein TonB